jgi:tRNA modification GTPase
MGNECICAIATGQGGAISIIRVSGEKALEKVSKIFSKELTKAKSHTTHFGLIKNEAGEIIDEVLVNIFHEGKSFTGEESAEISCHGSSFIQQQILQLLFSAGCRMAEAGEFTMRAYLNGKMDLSQAEAVADLIAVQSKKAHEIAMNQLRGGFSNELKELRSELIHFASMVELELDFGEEDVEFADRTEMLALVKRVSDYVLKLIESFGLGNVIKNGVPIALVGRPNAGKSTVLNALLNEERAIVSDIPGTTRDTIEESFTHEGLAFRLIDTAGIRESSDEIEQRGIERTMEKIQQARLVIYLFDTSDFEVEDVLTDQATFLKGIPHLLVGTKNDIYSKNKKDYISKIEHKTGIHIPLLCIKDEADRRTLLNNIYELAVGKDMEEHSTIVTNVRHVQNLELAAQSLLKAKTGIEKDVSGDFIAMDIRQALFQIGQITAEISTEDLLGDIFSNFCIGK